MSISFAPSTEKAKHIIVVDDDLAILDAIQLMLERRGYRITAFNDGNAVLNGNYDVPDMIILDKQLPGMDGLDICRRLKSRDIFSKIPILILSASPHISQLAREANADEFLEKPFKMQLLREIVDRLSGGLG